MSLPIALLLIVSFYWLFRLYKKRNEANDFNSFLATFAKPKIQFIESSELDQPVSFGYKNMWFAVKAGNKEEIEEVLNLKLLGKSNWNEGLKNAYDYRIFITPEIDGWNLIVGNAFMSDLDEKVMDSDLCNLLSNKFGEAQFFYTHRITEYHIWAKSLNGQLQRYYSYLGEQTENIRIEGEPTPCEKGLKLIDTFSEEAKKDDYFEDETLIWPDESLVMEIAENWSINPTVLEKYKHIEKGFGLVCELK